MDSKVWYSITHSQSGLAFDILDLSEDVGAPLIQWNATASTNQQFRFIESDSNYYRLMARHSGLVLDLYDLNESDGADIVQWEDTSGENQQFQVQDVGSGNYRFVNRLSGKALVPENGSLEPLTRITQVTPSANSAQQWRLAEVAAVVDPPEVPDPGEVGECGTGDADAIITGGPGNYQLNGRGIGGNFVNAIIAAFDSLPANRNQQASVSIRADGDLGRQWIDIPSNTLFEACGTINVGNSGRGSIRATGVSNVSIPFLSMTGSPYFGLEFWGVDKLHLGQVDLRFSGGLGIRFQRDRPGSRNVQMDYVYVSGTGNHGVETWNVDGLTIGTVVARDVGNAGLLLNNSRNATIGLVDGDNVATGTGYATLRFANTAGRLGNGSYDTNIYVDRVVSRGGGRGVFCVSQSGGVEINSIDLAGNGGNSVLLENCYNVKINGGTINGGGELRIAARSEFANSRDITISNVSVTDTGVRESPCGENTTWQNVNVVGGGYNICD